MSRGEGALRGRGGRVGRREWKDEGFGRSAGKDGRKNGERDEDGRKAKDSNEHQGRVGKQNILRLRRKIV